MVTPTVSVLMPVYNAERYVAEAVESVLGQTFADFEFIIIDDGSTDGSLAVLRRYAERDARIRLISRPNTGYLVALNEMLTLARGEFVARMDADDVCLPERFARQLAFLAERPDCLAVSSHILLIDGDGDPLCVFDFPSEHEAIDGSHIGGGPSTVAHPALFVRADAVTRVGGYRAPYLYAEDVDLFLRLAEHGRLANVPEVLLKYRRHLDTVGSTRLREQADAKNRAVQDARQRRGLPREVIPVPAATPTVGGQHEMWAWWALGAGHLRSARKHAWAAVRRNPLAVSSWRALCCAYRGY